MDKVKAAKLGNDIAVAIKTVCEEHGVELTGRRGTFGEGNLELKLTLVEKAPEGLEFNPNSREAQTYRQYATTFDLPELGTKFKTQGKEFTIIGYNSRAPKWPVQAKAADGRTYKFAEETVKRAVKS